MHTSITFNVIRPVPTKGAGCTIDLGPSLLTEVEVKDKAAVFATLGDPTRLGILALLAAQPAPLCVCEVNEAFPLGQPTISHHLKVLRQAGLVHSEKRGLWVYYWPNISALRKVMASVETLLPKDDNPDDGKEVVA